MTNVVYYIYETQWAFSAGIMSNTSVCVLIVQLCKKKIYIFLDRLRVTELRLKIHPHFCRKYLEIFIIVETNYFFFTGVFYSV